MIIINRYTLIIPILLIQLHSFSQLTPQEAILSMTRGINMGNTLEPPDGETTWGNPLVVEAHFDDYKNAGFTCIRIPITWDNHTDKTSPYTINATWLNRVEEIVDWGLSKNLIIIINAHHEGWIKNNYSAQNVARFDSIWSQVATRFKDKSDSLLFEVINEPEPLSLENVNDLNAQVINIMRKTNPTRIILFSGHRWSNAEELIQAAVPNDDYLMGYYHSYDPYPFGLVGTGSYGSNADIAATENRFITVANWSETKNIPVVLSEFGYMKKCEYNSRMCAYATATEKALLYNVAFNVWEDGGDFKFYNRNEGTFSEIKDILINTYPTSPNKLQINNYADTLIQLRWENRLTTDNLIVERRIGNAPFADFSTLNSISNEFIDTTVVTGKTYYYRLSTIHNDTLIQSYPVQLANLVPTQKPYSGTAFEMPGTLQAEDFDIGIEGTSYHDEDFLNKGMEYRLGSGTDIYKTGSRIYVSDIDMGEWMEYTINVSQSGTYSISVYVATAADGAEMILQFGDDSPVNYSLENTGGLTNFLSQSISVNLTEGEQIMRLSMTSTPTFNIDRFIFSEVSALSNMNLRPLTISPNPTNGIVSITGYNGTGTIVVYALNGTKLWEQELDINETKLNLGNLDKGMYVIRCTDNEFTQTKKIIVE